MKTQQQIEKLRSLQESFDNLAETYDKLANTSAIGIEAELQQGKQVLVDAIEYKGGESSADKSLQGIAEDIKEIPNFNTNGFEYVSEAYKPTTLIEAFNYKACIKSIYDNSIQEFNYTFYGLTSLQEATLLKATVITNNCFNNCISLRRLVVPNLIKLSNYALSGSGIEYLEIPTLLYLTDRVFYSTDSAIKYAIFPSVKIAKDNVFYGAGGLLYLELGVLIEINDIFFTQKRNLRNITIGVGTDIKLPFQNWTANNVIAEGQSGIDELNSNLRTNLLDKLYDHSQDGQTRTLRLGWLAHVTQENIDYANSKGWTLTT